LALAGEGPGRLRGEVTVSGGLSVQHSRIGIRLDRASADVLLEGTRLSFASIRTDSPVATVGATARLDVSRGSLDVKYDAQLDLGRLDRWWTDAPPVSGSLEASGTVVGTLAEPVATFVARGKSLRWRDVTDATLSASGRWSGGDLVIDPYEVSSHAGAARVSGRAHLAVAGGARSSSLRIDARAEDPRRLARLTRAPALPTVPVTLVADLTWAGPVPDGATLGGNLRMAALDGESPGVAFATLEANGEDDRWTVRQRAALPGGTGMTADLSVVVDPAMLTRSTIDGRVAAQSANLAAALLDLRRRGLSSANDGESLGGGRATADATLTGTLARPRLQARLAAESLTLPGL
jgi:hypothetical protein